MKHITITPKDIEKYKINFTDTNNVIDELAYSAGEYTSEDLWENDEGIPQSPYMYDYEAALLEATKTEDKLYKLAQALEVSLNANIGKVSKKAKLQAGAWLAINDDTTWKKLLDAWTEKLQDERMEGICKDYNDELQKAINDYTHDQYKEWLNGDYRNWSGIIYQIGKFYTENKWECSYDEKKDEYTFALEEDEMRDDMESHGDEYTTPENYKAFLLEEIRCKSKARKAKDAKKREENKIERERVALYKKEQEAREKAERVEKLSAMKLK